MSSADATAWDEEELFHDSDTYFDRLIAAVDAAKTSIEYEVFIFDDDALGARLAGSLAAAARRGVKVRVMVDGFGAPQWAGRFQPELARAGAATRVFNPVPWREPRLFGRAFSARKFLSGLVSLVNRRNHRKVLIVDGHEAWLGSINASARSLRAVVGEKAWHECGLRVRGGEVPVLREAFQHAWLKQFSPLRYNAWRTAYRRRVAVIRAARLVRLNTPRAQRRRVTAQLLARLAGARVRIWIETPYFIPPGSLARALRRAAARGVDVRIVVPRRSDFFFLPWVIPAAYERLLAFGARVFEYQPSMLHAKILLADDWAAVGSTNMNHRSLLHDLEVDAVLTHEASRESLVARYMNDLEKSAQVTLTELGRRPWYQRWCGRLLLGFRYWM